jgi:predicted nucleic acid-binding protein
VSVFIDTGIFIAYINRKDEHHAAASALLEDVMKNKYGPAFTSDFVFGEAVTFILYKTGDINKAISMRDLIFGNEERGIPRFMNVLYVDEDLLKKAWSTFVKYADKKMSFTDCSIIEMMRNKGVEHMASFDSGFDGIISRLVH